MTLPLNMLNMTLGLLCRVEPSKQNMAHIQALLESKADANSCFNFADASDFIQRVPKEVVTTTQLVEYTREKGIRLNQHGRTALTEAISNRYPFATIRLLVESRANVDGVDEWGDTIFHVMTYRPISFEGVMSPVFPGALMSIIQYLVYQGGASALATRVSRETPIARARATKSIGLADYFERELAQAIGEHQRLLDFVLIPPLAHIVIDYAGLFEHDGILNT